MTREVRKRAPFDSTSAWNPFHFLSQMPLNDMKVTSSIIVSRHSGAQAAIEIAQETDGNNRLRRLPDLSCFITLTRMHSAGWTRYFDEDFLILTRSSQRR